MVLSHRKCSVGHGEVPTMYAYVYLPIYASRFLLTTSYMTLLNMSLISLINYWTMFCRPKGVLE